MSDVNTLIETKLRMCTCERAKDLLLCVMAIHGDLEMAKKERLGSLIHSLSKTNL